jgi:hypothetical protein
MMQEYFGQQRIHSPVMVLSARFRWVSVDLPRMPEATIRRVLMILMIRMRKATKWGTVNGYNSLGNKSEQIVEF